MVFPDDENCYPVEASLGFSGVQFNESNAMAFNFINEAVVSCLQNEFLMRTQKGEKEFEDFHGGYLTGQFVLCLICNKIAKKENINPTIVLEYFQRAALLGNIGYLRILKKYFHTKFINFLAELPSDIEYDDDFHKKLVEYGVILEGFFIGERHEEIVSIVWTYYEDFLRSDTES